MFGLGIPELLLILVVSLFFFGGKRLPELGSSLGRAIREFGHAVRELKGPEEERPRETPLPREQV